MILQISQELDKLLNKNSKGEATKEQLEAKRQELHEALKKRL